MNRRTILVENPTTPDGDRSAAPTSARPRARSASPCGASRFERKRSAGSSSDAIKSVEPRGVIAHERHIAFEKSLPHCEPALSHQDRGTSADWTTTQRASESRTQDEHPSAVSTPKLVTPHRARRVRPTCQIPVAASGDAAARAGHGRSPDPGAVPFQDGLAEPWVHPAQDQGAVTRQPDADGVGRCVVVLVIATDGTSPCQVPGRYE